MLLRVLMLCMCWCGVRLMLIVCVSVCFEVACVRDVVCWCCACVLRCGLGLCMLRYFVLRRLLVVGMVCL